MSLMFNAALSFVASEVPHVHAVCFSFRAAESGRPRRSSLQDMRFSFMFSSADDAISGCLPSGSVL